MAFNGRLKLIDVDGCVKVGQKLNITDSSISFSPCYCAPEWAHFLIDESSSTILASPGLDAWSVGMTICELVTMDAVLKPMYASFMRNSQRNQREAGFHFMEWLSSVKEAPIPKAIAKFEGALGEIVKDFLCVPDSKVRKSCAQSLGHAWLQGMEKEDMRRFRTDGSVRNVRTRDEWGEESSDFIIHKGVLYKLNAGENKDSTAAWLERDMWMTSHGNLCYWSKKENKPLVLMDAYRLRNAEIRPVPRSEGVARDFCFEVKTIAEDEGEAELKESSLFASDSAEMTESWIEWLRKASDFEFVRTFHLGDQMAKDLADFKLTVKNRRQRVSKTGGFEPTYRGNLWKVKTEGDPTQQADWFDRDFCIAKNGSLTYYSKREEKQLAYYTAADIASSTVQRYGKACARSFAFSISLPAVNEVQFEPGLFAAESDELLQQWFAEFSAHGATLK